MFNKKTLNTLIVSACLCGSGYASADENTNSIVFNVPVQQVYDYVSEPSRWHEWHPVSLGADSSSATPLGVGDHFKEQIRLYGQEIEMDYEVVTARPPYEFKTAFTSSLIDGTIHYQLEEVDGGTRFTRTLNYSIDKYIASLKDGMQEVSGVALNNLKAKLEEQH